ncbi:MAG: hypothetical protein O3A10_04430 [Chloroflexi bacterium]|nr:hypothetical protein [Chloroflexota bacterium]
MLVRNAVIYGPTSLVVVGLLLLALNALVGGNAGAVLPVLVLGIVAFAVVYEFVAAMRDLRAEPVATEGEAVRIWKKSKLLIFGRQDYLMLERQVFEVGVLAATELHEGQRVSIRHWPHTMRVITIERIVEPPQRQPRR